MSSKDPTYQLPRVLGLTATIIRGIKNVHNIPEDVLIMEKSMHCRAVTYHDYEEVLK
jgi:hypothetical protein